MNESIDDDTLQAVKSFWESDPTLPAIVVGSVQTGRLKSPQAMPYASVEIQPLRRESAGTGGLWHDYRKVLIEVRGIRADVIRVMKLTDNMFHRNMVLVFPSGSRFIRWWPEDCDSVTQDPDTKDGFDIWIGEIHGTVWSIRDENGPTGYPG